MKRVEFQFNDGEIKILDKPLANRLQTLGEGSIVTDKSKAVKPKAEKAKSVRPPSNKQMKGKLENK